MGALSDRRAWAVKLRLRKRSGKVFGRSKSYENGRSRETKSSCAGTRKTPKWNMSKHAPKHTILSTTRPFKDTQLQRSGKSRPETASHQALAQAFETCRPDHIGLLH